MPHQRWLKSCGDLALVDWYISSYGLVEYTVQVRRAQELLEDDKNPVRAGSRLLALLAQMNADPTVPARIAAAATRPGDREALSNRIADLASTLLDYPYVEDAAGSAVLPSFQNY